MRKVKIFLLAILSVSAVSCSQRWCNTKYPQIASRDSLYIETVKEIPIYLPGDSILVNVPVDCPDQDLVNVETGKLKQQISILKGQLISNTNIKPDTVFVPVTEIKTVIKEVKVPEEVRFVPKFFKFYTWGFVFIIFAIIIYLVIKYKIKIISLFKK